MNRRGSIAGKKHIFFVAGFALKLQIAQRFMEMSKSSFDRFTMAGKH